MSNAEVKIKALCRTESLRLLNYFDSDPTTDGKQYQHKDKNSNNIIFISKHIYEQIRF